MAWVVAGGGAMQGTFASVAPLSGGEYVVTVDDENPAYVDDVQPFAVTDGTLASNAWGAGTVTDMSRQFVGIGNIAQGDDVDFVLSIDEQRPLYISDTATPFLLIQEVMETP